MEHAGALYKVAAGATSKTSGGALDIKKNNLSLGMFTLKKG
jgi:hypothetical protein